MTKANIEIPIAQSLTEKLSEEFFWEEFSGWPQSDQNFAALIVARVDGLAVSIFANEHPPPHFHVKYQDQEASFSIINCARLRGGKGLERYESRIRKWWLANQTELIEQWNSSRPSNCPVGPIVSQQKFNSEI